MSQTNSLKTRLNNFLMIKEVPLLLVIIVSLIVLSIFRPTFLSPGNIHAVLLAHHSR